MLGDWGELSLLELLNPAWDLEAVPVLGWEGPLEALYGCWRTPRRFASMGSCLLGTWKPCLRENLLALTFFCKTLRFFRNCHVTLEKYPGQNTQCGFHVQPRWLDGLRETWPSHGFPQLLENCKTEEASNVRDWTDETFYFSLVTFNTLSPLPTGSFQLCPLYLSEGDHKINSGIFSVFPRFTLCIRQCSVNYSSTFSLEQSVRRVPISLVLEIRLKVIQS